MEYLSDRYRSYAIDLWGFGDSDKLRGLYTIDSYVDLLREYLDEMGIWPTPLVGHGLGGIIALVFAAMAPAQVERVAAVSVPVVGTAIDRALSSLFGDKKALASLIALRANFPEVSLEAEKADAWAVTDSVRSLLESGFQRVLPVAGIPVLLLYGTDDPLVRWSQPGWMEDCDKNVRAIPLRGVRHFPMLEEPSKFNRLLTEFLEAGDDLTALGGQE